MESSQFCVLSQLYLYSLFLYAFQLLEENLEAMNRDNEIFVVNLESNCLLSLDNSGLLFLTGTSNSSVCCS